jgi:hypothetical protein
MAPHPVEFLFPLLLAIIHLNAGQLARLGERAAHRFESFSGGVASAYVFLMLLPKLASNQKVLERAASDWLPLDYLYHHAYLVGMIGFAVYYGISAVTSADSREVPEKLQRSAAMVGLSTYSFLLGDSIATQPSLLVASGLMTVGLGLHVLGLDAVSHRQLGPFWDRLRWVLAASVILGWTTGSFAPLPAAAHAILMAFLTGGVIIHVVVYELPRDRRPAAFFAGALIFTMLVRLALIASGQEGEV